eukprot:TRINITY_DN832_c0_g1_i1.p3 TRINITY_DN832_c0_g1~~TRINITY_DN832_c0_g1_i1.p3  ORF type:complete len:200 (-),score=43.69 TRINITY_DN832_c0_g1_i1:1701-2300(-)
MAHCHSPEGVKLALQYGCRSIEHGTYLDQEAIEMMSRMDVFLVPTISIDYWMESLKQKENRAVDTTLDKSKKINESFGKTQYICLAEAIKAGVKIVTGTDYVGWSQLSINVNEITKLVELGMKPMNAIKSATSLAAECLQWHKVGRIQENAYADIIAVKTGDLINNLGLLEQVDFVMKDGTIMKQNNQPTTNLLNKFIN